MIIFCCLLLQLFVELFVFFAQEIHPTFTYSRREPNSHGFERQISAPATEKILAISYIASHFLFASAKYLLAQNCVSPSGVEFFDGFCQISSCKIRILQDEIWRKTRKILAAGRMSSALFGYSDMTPAVRRMSAAGVFICSVKK